jgi:hypothetical protein
MPLTEQYRRTASDMRGWQCPPIDATTLWDSRHEALESQFANAEGAWVLVRKKSDHDSQECLSPPRKPNGYYKCITRSHDDNEVVEVRERSEQLRDEFESLSAQWQRDTRYLSQVSKKITHPSLLRIIGMGKPAIPLILEALRKKPAHWFVALRATTNTDPAKQDDTPSQAREAWIAWGIFNGYID